MKKMIKLIATILIVGSVVYACKVKQQQNNLSPQKNQPITLTQQDDNEDIIIKMLSKKWIVNVVNYQADARKNVLYERGIDANLHDFSKESFKLSTDETVNYTDGAGKKHVGTWKLKDNNAKLLMEFEDGQVIAWDIIQKNFKHLDLHLSIDAKKVKWDIINLNDIDIQTAVVFAGFFAGVVDEKTQRINVTYRMMPTT